MLNLFSVSTRLKACYALSLTVAPTCFPSFFKWVHNGRRTNQAIRNIHRLSEDHAKIMQYLVAASLQATLGFVSRLGSIARRLGLPHFKTSNQVPFNFKPLRRAVAYLCLHSQRLLRWPAS
ncbi:hypothetical protein B0H14DRAFT_1300291 [Mycena olivaceomarginata]|nr:hypothetical protein B0H14DRAFT_1300291 [Mycena olivaceomarginata]